MDEPQSPSYIGSLIDGWLKRKLFDRITYYCMFFGYPGSGHSLVGSLMDAHPNMIIAHELDALDLLRRGYGQNQLFSAIMQRSRQFTQEGRLWKDHQYTVEGQYQGRYDQNLVVIGDKKGGWSSRYVENDSELLPRLLKKINKQIRFIHVTRNPYDNISTIARRSGRPLKRANEIYFNRVAGVQQAKDLTDPADWFDLRHEDVIANPAESLRSLCSLFGLSCSTEYVEACTSLIHPSPNKTREKQPWDKELIKIVAENIALYPFLHSYTYEN